MTLRGHQMEVSCSCAQVVNSETREMLNSHQIGDGTVAALRLTNGILGDVLPKEEVYFTFFLPLLPHTQGT